MPGSDHGGETLGGRAGMESDDKVGVNLTSNILQNKRINKEKREDTEASLSSLSATGRGAFGGEICMSYQ